jgi:hypothetical protein
MGAKNSAPNMAPRPADAGNFLVAVFDRIMPVPSEAFINPFFLFFGILVPDIPFFDFFPLTMTCFFVFDFTSIDEGDTGLGGFDDILSPRKANESMIAVFAMGFNVIGLGIARTPSMFSLSRCRLSRRIFFVGLDEYAPKFARESPPAKWDILAAPFR